MPFKRTYTDNTDTHYTYDELGRIKTVTSYKLAEVDHSASPLVTTYTYTAVGALVHHHAIIDG